MTDTTDLEHEYVAGISSPARVAAAGMLLLGMALAALACIPLIALDFADGVRGFYALLAEQLIVPTFTVLTLFIVPLAAWQIEYAVRGASSAARPDTRKAQQQLSTIAVVFVGPVVTAVLVVIHLGFWMKAPIGEAEYGGTIGVTIAGVFVLWIATGVATAPPPNAHDQLVLVRSRVRRARSMLSTYSRLVLPTPRRARATVALTLGALLVVPTAAAIAFALGSRASSRGTFVAAVLLVSFASAYGVAAASAARLSSGRVTVVAAWAGWVLSWFGWALLTAFETWWAIATQNWAAGAVAAAMLAVGAVCARLARPSVPLHARGYARACVALHRESLRRALHVDEGKERAFAALVDAADSRPWWARLFRRLRGA